MREVAKSYASEQSVARSWNRKPVLINGADIAGLALAQTLRSGQVPFLIFERHSKNSPMATKRQWRFHFDSRYFDGLAQRMGLPQAGVLLDALKNDIKDRQTRVMTRNLEQVLTSDIDIKYGHHLSVEGINVEGGAISPHYSHEKIIHRTEGSMIVGADGQFSTVRRHHSNTMLSDWLHQLPALVYRVSLHVPITFWDTHIKPFVDHQRNARMTRNNVFLSLEFMRMHTRTKDVHLNFHFSRMAKTMEDWHAFYGMWPNQRDYSFVEHKFDDVVASEIDALGDLPPPFGAAFLLAKQSPVAQRTIVDTVQIPTDQLPRRLTVNKASAPAVVIGDAAHMLHTAMDDESITHACLDGVMLGEKIIEAAENDAMFRNVPEHFYWDSTRRWATHAKGWLEKWYRAHDLPPDYAGREGEIPVTREQGFMHFRRAQPRNKVAIGPWVSVEDFFRRERPKGDRTPESDEEVYFASKHALRQELIDMRFAPQEAGKVNSMHKVRMKYAEGGKDSATDIEVRHSDFYHVSPEEWQEAFERQQRKERR